MHWPLVGWPHGSLAGLVRRESWPPAHRVGAADASGVGALGTQEVDASGPVRVGVDGA